MYGKIISSNGIIRIVGDEYQTTLEENVLYLNIRTAFDCLIYINNDIDGIYIFKDQVFEIKDMPVKSFKIVKAVSEAFPDGLSWYGLY